MKAIIESFNADGHGGMAALAHASGVPEHAISKFLCGQQIIVKRLHDFLGVRWDDHRGVYVMSSRRRRADRSRALSNLPS